MAHVVLYIKASVQRLNKQISTEAELVGGSECLPYNLWLMGFLHVRAYVIMNIIVYQYNKVKIRMKNNGSNSCTGKSIHINIRYFFQVQSR